jgi:hypothetical protein
VIKRNPRLGFAVLSVAAMLAACQQPQAPIPAATPPAQSQPGLALSILPVGPSNLPLGQTIGFRLMSVAGGYGHLYVIDNSGAVQAWAENLPLRPGRAVEYPAQGSGLLIRASPPEGSDQVIFMATAQPLSGFVDGRGSAVTEPVTLPYSAEEFRRQLAALANSLPDRSWGVSEIDIRVFDPEKPQA